MASPNVWLRDPLLYRIRHMAHHHIGDKWVIYPLYDFAHCLSDYLEGITHSFCTVEFDLAPRALRLDPREPRSRRARFRISTSSPRSRSVTRS
ncbi:MAG: glutamate--tRNA ligase family protein [Nibricoccus sp.]